MFLCVQPTSVPDRIAPKNSDMAISARGSANQRNGQRNLPAPSVRSAASACGVWAAHRVLLDIRPRPTWKMANRPQPSPSQAAPLVQVRLLMMQSVNVMVSHGKHGKPTGTPESHGLSDFPMAITWDIGITHIFGKPRIWWSQTKDNCCKSVTVKVKLVSSAFVSQIPVDWGCGRRLISGSSPASDI